MAAVVLGRYSWGLTRDNEGHREYSLRLKIKSETTDGPQAILMASGAPTIGSSWAYESDLDLWAKCHPDVKLTMIREGEPNRYWFADYKFSTKPLKRCQDTSIEDPLLEPQKISGSFVREKGPYDLDIDLNVPKNIAHEPILGLEKNKGYSVVNIEQNVLELQLDTVTDMMNDLNDAELWGHDAGDVQLIGFSWERKLYGTCSYYYTRKFEFSVNDGSVTDTPVEAGIKVRKGAWVLRDAANPNKGHNWVPNPLMNKVNPQDFEPWLDPKGQPMGKTLLDADGDPLEEGQPPIKHAPIHKYYQSNFLLLGIPTSL